MRRIERVFRLVAPPYCHQTNNSLDPPQTSTGETQQHKEQGKAGILLIFPPKEIFTVISHRDWAACGMRGPNSSIAGRGICRFFRCARFGRLRGKGSEMQWTGRGIESFLPAGGYGNGTFSWFEVSKFAFPSRVSAMQGHGRDDAGLVELAR